MVDPSNAREQAIRVPWNVRAFQSPYPRVPKAHGYPRDTLRSWRQPEEEESNVKFQKIAQSSRKIPEKLADPVIILMKPSKD